MNKLTFRARLVFMIVSILIFCSVGLTIITNYSASQMAGELAQTTTPATIAPEGANTIESDSAKEVTMPQAALQDQEKIVNNFYDNSMFYMLLVIVIGGISTYYLSGKILKPLTELNGKIKQSTVTNLSETINVPKVEDEIAEITVSFNMMKNRIYEAFIFQQQFSANVAHELKTPLTILKAKIAVFNKGNDKSIQDYKQLVNGLDQQIDRLSDIVQILLNLTNNEEISEKQNVLVSDIIDNILSEQIEAMDNKNIKVNVKYNSSEIYGNIDLLYQMFYNLIQNSIKYNLDNGVIEIEAKTLQDKTIIKIIDSGIGIPVDQRGHIFEPFYRVDKSRSREIGGVGLGLSITKKIVDKHKGKISISDGINQGTCFIIEIPNKV